MKFRFEPNLPHQLAAIRAVIELFDGATKTQAEERLFGEVSPNILLISDQQLTDNKQKLYQANNIPDPRDINDPDFSVEMETGTGKTYVYLRTAFELFRQYGLTKFIIVTPNVAVKEGVLKTLKDTQQHFFDMFGVRSNYFEYNSKRARIDLRNFTETNQLSIMVSNTQAFTGDTKIINAEGRDDTHGQKLSALVAKVRPIIILDEPQEGMDASKTGDAIAAFNPLFKLRYSATHKIVKNLIYRLTPYDAYNKGLVKKIEVFSVTEDNIESNAHLVFKDIKLGSAMPQAKLELQVKTATGFAFKTILVRSGDDLRAKTNNPAYASWQVENIAGGLSGVWKIRFTNGKQLELGDRQGWNKEAVFEQQLRWTIKKHLQKQQRLAKHGVKVLSLCFIDRVDNYIHPDSLLRVLFEKLYAQEYEATYGTSPENIQAVHGGYFSRTTSGEFTDNETSMSKNRDMYDEILKDKEWLLSKDNPRQFIFSHSALGVGWDNPNVFQICTLNETHSLTQKRQEIGRGLRLSVDEKGDRIRDPEETASGEEINLLTVIANQSYESFVTDYQNELAVDYGVDPTGQAKPRNAKNSLRKIYRREDVFTSEDFRTLWDRINSRTRCSVLFNEDELTRACIEALNAIHIARPQIRLGLNQLTSIAPGEVQSKLVGTDVIDIVASGNGFDIIDEISEATSVSHQVLQNVLLSLSDKTGIINNPADFIQKAIVAINRVLDSQLIRFVEYIPTNQTYPVDEFTEIEQTYQDIYPVNRGLYDAIIYDSDIETHFAAELDATAQVRLFLKLPRWYRIPLPNGGTYNPDWAMIIEKPSLEISSAAAKHYFVVETKGDTDIGKLSPEEQFKIQCAIKHFRAIGLEEFVAPVKPRVNFKSSVNEKVPNLL